jgi:hypothetical protein
MLQAGANPIAVIEEAVKRLDDRLDVTKFFPNPMAAMQQPQQQSQQQQKKSPPPPHQATGQPPVAANPMPGIAK